MEDGRKDHGPQVMNASRDVRMSPKVVFWVVVCVATVAFIGFASMFVNSGYRNGWW